MKKLDRTIAAVLSLTFIVALLAGCGGGGGDESAVTTDGFGNSLPPSTGPGDVENFFPNEPGSSWNYFATVTNPLPGEPAFYMDSVTVTGTKAVLGQLASIFLESNPYGSGSPVEAYYYKNDGGVAFLGTNDVTDEITPKMVPFIVGLFPVSPGVVAKFDKNGLDFGDDLDGDGINETVNLTLTSTVIGFEPISIGIGSFANTAKHNESITGSVVLSFSKVAVPFSASMTRWSAAGVGVIKSREISTVDATTSIDDKEARGYVINGTAHGFGLPYKLASNLATGDSDYSTPGPPALASDGQNFLAVSANASGMPGILFNAQGTPLNNVNLAGGTAPIAAFDGTNYWVIYSSANSCLAQRVSPTGILVDVTGINLVTVGGTFSSITSKGFVFGNTNGLLAYSKFNNTTNQHELHGVLVNPDGTVGVGEFPIAIDNSTHLNPTVGFDGTNYFVAWAQLPSSGSTLYDIYGVRISPTGTVIDPVPIPISTAANAQSSPSIAFDGSNYLVVWLDMRNQTAVTGVPYPDVYGPRVSAAGILLDGPAATGGFAINSGGSRQRYSPYVAFTGSEYLTTWATLGYANTGSPGIQAARVSTAATLPSGVNMAITVSGPPTVDTFSQFVFPVIATGSQHAAVIWLDNAELAGSQKGLLGASVFPF